MEFDAAFIAEQIEIEKELERRKINEIRIENENRLLEQTGTANEDRKHQTLDKQSAADYLSKESPSIDCEAGLKDPIKSTKTNEQNSNETQEQLMAKLIEEKIVEQLNRLNLDRNGGDKEEKLWRNLSSTTVNSSSSSSVFSMYDFAKINDDKPILDDRDDDRFPLSSCSSSSTVVNKPETITKSSKQMIRLLREADREGFTIDDLDLALRICPNNPLVWLRKNWRNSIETIKRMLNNQIEDFENQTHSKEISENKTENDGSRITETEVGNALHKTKGNIWRTIEQCLQQYLMRRANKISDGKALQQSNATNSEDSITKRDEDEILMIKLLQNLSPIELREMESMLNEWHDRRSKQMNRDRSSKSVPRSKRKVPSIEDVEKRIRSYLSDGTTTEEELDREVARVFEKRSPFIDGLDSETDQTPTFTNDGDVSEIVKHHESIRMENDQIKQRIGTKLKDLNRRNDQKKFMFKVIDPLTETSSVDSFQSSIENNDEIDNQLKNHLQIVKDNQAASSVSPISLSEGSLKSSDVQQSRSLKPPSLDNLFRASSSTISSVAPTIILDSDLDEDSDRSFLSIIESKSPVKIEEKLLIRKEFEVLQSQTDGIVLERLQKSNDLIPIRIVSDDRIVATQSNQNKNLIHLQNPIATIPGKSRSLTELTSKNFDDKNDPMDSVPQKPVYSKLRGLDKLKKASIWNSTEIDSIENFNNSIKSDNSISSIKSEPSIRTEKLTEEINEQRPNSKKDKARKFIIEKLRSIGSTNSIDLIDDNDDDYDGENKDVPDEALNQNTEDNFKNIVEKKEKIKPIISMFWNNNNRERGQNPLEHNRDDYSYEFQWARTEFECELCARIVPIEMIVSMITCTHYSCLDCMREYLHNQIREQQRLVISCPFCDEPNISPENDDQVFEYLQIFDPFVRHIIDPNVYELFQRKVRDRALMRDPNFLWCIQCSSGFIVPNPKALSVICPDCRTVFCRLCKKLWKTQHLNVHCEQYAEWEKQNDLDYAEQQLNKHLKEFGIECPNCHFRYQLAKGGCMHFRCTQCSYDFCGGCYRPFKLGSRCFRAKVCERLGLHAHHPRNCLFYLRDKDVADLQKLLTENNIEFKKNSEENGGGGIKYDPNNRCQVMEQKEVDFVMKDKPCNRFVETAGLCRLHYKEYLGDLIYKNQIDPISIFTETELELTLKRENIRIPSKLRGEDYLDKLRKLILEKIPLDLN
ncbi:IBR domain containing protein [Sarcoptes scabiei]|uniref:IBR domain containing protein n=1 Tax=Sarcoptes scabiei TaxID=52283 RepID=A0A131ZUD9_SARSC|nr:IBR domain containing protein [Sarcoptes scabiei]